MRRLYLVGYGESAAGGTAGRQDAHLPSGEIVSDDRPRETQEQFERNYAARSRATVAEMYELHVFPALPCDCDWEGCTGWRRRYASDDEGEP